VSGTMRFSSGTRNATPISGRRQIVRGRPGSCSAAAGPARPARAPNTSTPSPMAGARTTAASRPPRRSPLSPKATPTRGKS
jgi:hypothetical protein